MNFKRWTTLSCLCLLALFSAMVKTFIPVSASHVRLFKLRYEVFRIEIRGERRREKINCNSLPLSLCRSLASCQSFKYYRPTCIARDRRISSDRSIFIPLRPSYLRLNHHAISRALLNLVDFHRDCPFKSRLITPSKSRRLAFRRCWPWAYAFGPARCPRKRPACVELVSWCQQNCLGFGA